MAFVCQKYTYNYYEDYIKSINTILQYQIHLYEGNTYTLPENINTIILVSIFPYINFSQQKKPTRVFLLNTEQLSRNDYIHRFIGMLLFYSNIYKQYIHDIPQIIDYSLINIQLLEKTQFKTYYLPYFPSIQEIHSLHTQLQCEKEYDIAFSGGIDTEKRSSILNMLKERGLRVYHIQAWGKERDREIAKCKLLLNIHYNHDYTIFEAMRCERWIFSGMTVLSESSQDTLYSHPCLVITDYDKIVNKAIELVADVKVSYPQYDQFQIERYSYIEKIQNIISEDK